MANTQMNNEPKKAKGPIANNKWLTEFADVTVDEKELQQLDSKDRPSAAGDEATFKEIFENSQTTSNVKEGEVVNGAVIAITGDYVTVDIGYKMEGLVPLDEFRSAEGTI